MKKIIILLMLFFGIQCYGKEKKDSQTDKELYRSLMKGNVPLENLLLSSQEIAKFFGIYMCPQHSEDEGVETFIFSYIGTDDSLNQIYHVGWFADGYVVTHINGDNKGFQTVVLNDEIIGISYPSDQKETGSIMNKYSWGFVTIIAGKLGVHGIRNFIKNASD